MTNKILALNLRLFEGEGGGADTGATTAVAGQETNGRNDLSNVVYGKGEDVQDVAAPEPEVKVTTKTTEDRSVEFENLIKGEYKDLFNARVQNIVQNRLKESKGAEEQLKGLQPILDILSQKYGVDAKDLKALSAAVEADDSYWEEEASSTGMSVEQVRELHRMRTENERYRRLEREAQKQRGIQEIQQKWAQETETTKQIYPSFNFDAEIENEDFSQLLRAGIPVKTAYEVVHKDELVHQAMIHTASEVKQKVVNDIMANGRRPAENGVSSQSPAVTKRDVNSLTKRDREEIERRVARGEKIRF
jgi:hypothetical protein